MPAPDLADESIFLWVLVMEVCYRVRCGGRDGGEGRERCCTVLIQHSASSLSKGTLGGGLEDNGDPFFAGRLHVSRVSFAFKTKSESSELQMSCLSSFKVPMILPSPYTDEHSRRTSRWPCLQNASQLVAISSGAVIITSHTSATRTTGPTTRSHSLGVARG